MRRDGLGREVVLSLVHDDGHVGGCANYGGMVEAMVVQLGLLWAWLGVEGWRVELLPVTDAVNALVRGDNCPRCSIVFGCGCSWQRTLAAQCPHGTAARVHALAHVVGYCTNDHPRHEGPPLPVWVRVYEAGSRMAHIAEVTDAVACCGHTPAEPWRGIGHCDQAAKAAALPMCRACTQAVGNG